MDLGFSLDLEAAKSAHKGGKMATGIYTVKIEAAYVDKSKGGDPMLSLQIRSDAGEVGFFNNLGINKTWNGGSENYQYGNVMEFIAASGATGITGNPCKRTMNDAEVDAVCIPELLGRELKVAVYQKFSKWEGNEKEELVLQQSFLTNGKTLAEQEAGKDAIAIVKTADRLKPYYDKTWGDAGATDTTAAPAAPSADAAASLFNK